MTEADKAQIRALLDLGMPYRGAVARVIPGKRAVPNKKAR